MTPHLRLDPDHDHDRWLDDGGAPERPPGSVCGRCGQPCTAIGSTVVRLDTRDPRLKLGEADLCEACTSDLAAWLRSPPAARTA